MGAGERLTYSAVQDLWKRRRQKVSAAGAQGSTRTARLHAGSQVQRFTYSTLEQSRCEITLVNIVTTGVSAQCRLKVSLKILHSATSGLRSVP